MAHRAGRLKDAPRETAALNLLIVARGQHELFRRLQRRLKGCTVVDMLFDRREGERRQTAQSVPVDQRREERRSARHPRDDLQQRKYIFARPQARCPHL
jgi:hypothetical protein